MKQFRRNLSFLLALVMVLSMVYIGPAESTSAAASDYISASYASNLSVKTTKTVSLVAEPTSSAASKYTLPASTMLTVKALHKNTSNTYWYEVLYYDMTLYVDATACTMVDHLTGDVTATDLLTPAALGYGAGFPITGTVSSTLNKLGEITAAVHYSSNITEQPAITSSDTVNGYSYTLDSSTVDNNLIFSDLAAGSYTFLLTVEAISYYIDASGALTTSTQTVVLDNKPLIITNASSPNPVIAKGIDVSYYQGNINWSSVASQIDFAILRIGYEYTLDSKFTEYAAACNQYDIPFGVYIYSYAESESEAIKEAEFVISVLKNYEVDLPVFFDIEDSCQSALGATAIQKIVKAFCETIKDAGYEPGLYTFLSWFNSYFYDSYYSSLPKWVAQVGVSSCSYAKGVTMWQYSWTGSFTGISGDVDCNYYYGEFPGMSSDTTYLSKCTYYPANLKAVVDEEVNMRSYPSTDYSILEELAAGTEIHVTAVYKNAYGNYWYQVNRDGTVGYIDASFATAQEFLYDDLSVVDPTMSDLALNAGYYLKGKLYSLNNNMYQVNARVYSGEDTLATPVLTSSAISNSKEYTLNYSTVCDNMIFSDLSAGYYTYEISADVKNYYVSNGTLTSQTENVVVWTAPFTVGGASITPPESTACTHTIVTQAGQAATCTAAGVSDGSYCSDCGVVFKEQTEIPATGHSYVATPIPATCLDYEKVKYVCASCGDTYSIYAFEQEAQWSEVKPNVDETMIISKIQYRYRDYNTITSYSTAVEGYTQVSKTWEQSGTGSNQYVAEWPTGYDTSHSLYSKYNNGKLSASETETAKTEVSSSAIEGYIYYHWCRGTYTDGPINRTTSATKDDTHTAFHSFVANVSTIDPTTLTAASDGSVTYAYANACTDSWWWYYIPVYKQTYTTYKALYTYEGWGSWSEWSDEEPATADNRSIETRTVYRATGAALGEHDFVDGICTVCGESDVCLHPTHSTDGICLTCGESVEHTYENGLCTVCGKTQLIPTIHTGGLSLSFEDEIIMNFYYTVENMEGVDVADMGLITWTTPHPDGTIEDARCIIPGAVTDGYNYMVRTEGIVAKELGDLVYARIYAKLADGSYVYSRMLATSPRIYAVNRIKNSSNEKMRAVCVALLNYGAAAQEFFGHKPYDLMNRTLTDEQMALVTAYSDSMVDTLYSVNSVKGANFVNDTSDPSFSRSYASASFNSAFALNFYFTPAHTPDGSVKMYYWSPDDFNATDVLTVDNATSCTDMTATANAGEFWGEHSGIAAKQINQPGYFAIVYQSGGVTYSSNVLVYSLGAYCKGLAAQTGSDIQPLAACTAVYGYYAKLYFQDLYG